MINLLPPDIKSSYDYASRNVHALRWLVAFAIALVGLGAIGTTGFIYMQHLSKDYQSQISMKESSLKQQKLDETQKAAKDISSSLKLAVNVLSKEVLFSELLKQLGSVTPNNVRLSSLNISQTTGALDITAASTDYKAATQLQVNLADPANKIFSKADIVNISCASGDGSSSYPCTVTIRALFAKDNPFLFINAKGN
jgi:Tfp pilus assembly protein PilN